MFGYAYIPISKDRGFTLFFGKVLVEGRLKLEQWQDQSGQKRSKHSVVVEVMQMLGSSGSEKPNNSQAGQTPTYEYQQIPKDTPQTQNNQSDIDEDEIPF